MGLTKSKWMATMVGNWNPSNFLLASSRELSFDSLHHQLNLHPPLHMVNIQGTFQPPNRLVCIPSSHFISSWFKPRIAGFLSMLQHGSVTTVLYIQSIFIQILSMP
jgi:hypothetical protein